MKLYLESCGHRLPKRCVTNEEFTHRIETSDEWIRQRTGIETRYLASDVVLDPEEQYFQPESLFELTKRAAETCMSGAEELRSKVGIVIVATTSSEERMPALAPLLQAPLGLESDVLCFDLNAACTGFVYALQMARGYLVENPERAALVIGAEKLSNLLDFDDRGTCILFGDGAAATLWTLGEGEPEVFISGTDSNVDFLHASQTDPLTMEGRQVFRFAVQTLPELLKNLSAKAGVKADLHFLHQANARIIQAVAKALDESIERFPMNLQHYGNTSAASLPLLLSDLWETGELDRERFASESYTFAGFGAGLSYGGLMTKGL